MPTYEYQCETCGKIEIFHGIMEEDKTVCPVCSKDGLVKLISAGSGFIFKHRAANQYNDILKAKYWRDHNGVRHKVTPADGHCSAPTVSSKQTRTPEEVAAIKKQASERAKKQRSEQSYKRYVEEVKRKKRQ